MFHKNLQGCNVFVLSDRFGVEFDTRQSFAKRRRYATKFSIMDNDENLFIIRSRSTASSVLINNTARRVSLLIMVSSVRDAVDGSLSQVSRQKRAAKRARDKKACDIKARRHKSATT
jgi:hypothetical protein